MSLSATRESVSQKRTLASLLAGREAKRPRQDDARRLQQAAIQLLHQHQNLSSLLLEAGSPNLSDAAGMVNVKQQGAVPEDLPSAFAGTLLVSELEQQAARLGVSVLALSVTTALESLIRLTADDDNEEVGSPKSVLLTSSQRGQLCSLLQSVTELLSRGAFCPKLFWQEYSKNQPKLVVLCHLHTHHILPIKSVLESDEGTRPWMVAELKALCCCTAGQHQQEGREVQQKVLSTVVGVLVGTGFEENQGSPVPNRSISLLCHAILDDMLCWLLNALDGMHRQLPRDTAAQLWIQVFDASLCGVLVSPDALRGFFTHSLTHALTYKPRLKVSDAIATQNEWSFAKTSRLLTALFCKLATVFTMEELLRHLQQVLETQEVNWQHVLSFLSTLLVYSPNARPSLKELLSRLLASAFEGYDLENMITAFLLARQGALEGPTFFPSYSDWFKMSFGGASGYHGGSKKSIVFLLKFLSDLVPFDPPQYLKVHILHPPYVAVKHRNLLQEYVSLAKTRLADLKVSVEDMGLYEDVSGAEPEKLQCQALQDVDKAVSLFESTGRIPATIMEASIFRRPYFLTRFLPALLTPRVLPLKSDAKMSFIEALKKADKIPATQYSSYLEACQRLRQQDRKGISMQTGSDDDNPLEVLNVQLMEFRRLVAQSEDGELSAQLSRISHTLNIIFPEHPDDPAGLRVVKLYLDTPLIPELHLDVVNRILRTFCQCLLEASRTNPPTIQSHWAALLVSVLLSCTQLLSALVHRLWDLFHNQGSSLADIHVLGLSALVVHLHASSLHSHLLQVVSAVQPEPVLLTDGLSAALLCTTQTDMLFCVRICVTVICYGICRGDSLSRQEQQDYIPTGLFKKLLYIVPRLLPEARRSLLSAKGLETPALPDVGCPGQNLPGLWGSAVDTSTTAWRKSALQLWRHSTFQQLAQLPQHQLTFSEWLAIELRVQRNEDVLPDADRQEYQQWSCLEVYLPRPVERGGCGGDLRTLCTHILNGIMDQQPLITSKNEKSAGPRPSDTGTCLPDILSRLQELVYEMQLAGCRSSRTSRDGACHFLLDLVSQRCSSDSPSIGQELSMQHTLHTWSRVLLALPAELCVRVRNERGRETLDCSALMEHVNQYQRKVCSPAGLVPYHLTAHFLQGMLSASVRCDHPSREVERAWSEISLCCPLLLVSTVHWWDRLSPVLSSLWLRLHGEDLLPEKLRLLADCQHWARSSLRGVSPAMPSAPPVLLAASLHRVWVGPEGRQQESRSFRVAMETLGQGKDGQERQVLVFLLFLCVTDLLSTILYPQEKGRQVAGEVCAATLSALVDSADWLLIFKSPAAEEGLYQSVDLLALDEYVRMRPLAFYSLLLEQSPELLERAVRCPGFLHTAVLCYTSLLQLFLDGHAPHPITEAQTREILGRAQRFLLSSISQTSPAALSSSQLRQLESLCAELDPEVAAALTTHLSPHSLCQEMDFF